MPDFGKALRQFELSKLEWGQARDNFGIGSSGDVDRNSCTSELRSTSPELPIPKSEIRNPQVAEIPPGWVETTPYGTHYIVRAVYPHDHFHGKVRLSRFSCSDLDQLMSLMREEARVTHRDRIIFLDTETTGMQGGTGICPFLVGLGFFVGDDFHMIQYFIRDFDEEPSMLYALGEALSRFEMVVTYNGAAFDLPLLETRFTLARLDNPFGRMAHFDLLFTARRLWRNGHGSCRLIALEREIVSFIRGPDVPGSMIPRVYFDFLNGRPNAALPGIFVHNVHDVISLAALTICACDRVTVEPAALDEALDLYSLARILEGTKDWRRSVQMYEMAISGGLPEPVNIKALENLAVIARRCGDHERAREICMNLMRRSEFSMTGYEGAAIYCEKVERDVEAARAVVEQALARLGEAPEKRRWRKLLQGRWQRLQQKVIEFTPSSATS